YQPQPPQFNGARRPSSVYSPTQQQRPASVSGPIQPGAAEGQQQQQGYPLQSPGNCPPQQPQPQSHPSLYQPHQGTPRQTAGWTAAHTPSTAQPAAEVVIHGYAS